MATAVLNQPGCKVPLPIRATLVHGGSCDLLRRRRQLHRLEDPILAKEHDRAPGEPQLQRHLPHHLAKCSSAEPWRKLHSPLPMQGKPIENSNSWSAITQHEPSVRKTL